MSFLLSERVTSTTTDQPAPSRVTNRATYDELQDVHGISAGELQYSRLDRTAREKPSAKTASISDVTDPRNVYNDAYPAHY